MKTLKKYINKIKHLIMSLLEWVMEVIMSIKHETEAITNRKYDFYEFLITKFADGTKDGVKKILNSKKAMLATTVALTAGTMVCILYDPKDDRIFK